MMDDTNPIFVYLDNSNIFVSTQSYSSKVNNYKEGIMDVQCRMNTSKLLDIVLNGRTPMLKKAYGHMPKEVKHELEKAGFKVFLSDSLVGEKEIDTKLTADAVEDIVRHNFRSKELNGHNGTLVLLSGDKDMLPLIQLARRYEWNVEVWAYENSLSGALQIETTRSEYASFMEVKPLEKYFKDFVFYDEKYSEVDQERTIIVRFKDQGISVRKMSDDSQKLVTKIVADAAKAHFQLPVVAKLTEQNNKQELAVSIIVVLDDRKLKKPLYNFQRDVVEKCSDVEREIRYQFKKKFLETSVFVSNLDRTLKNSDISELFKSFGVVEACELSVDEDGNPSGTGIVRFQNESSVIEAVHKLDGSRPGKNQKLMTVKPYRPKIGIDQVSVTKASDAFNGPSNSSVPQFHSRPTAENRPPSEHKAYRTKFCTREYCDKHKCIRAHSQAEIRCYHCGGNHISIACRK